MLQKCVNWVVAFDRICGSFYTNVGTQGWLIQCGVLEIVKVEHYSYCNDCNIGKED